MLKNEPVLGKFCQSLTRRKKTWKFKNYPRGSLFTSSTLACSCKVNKISWDSLQTYLQIINTYISLRQFWNLPLHSVNTHKSNQSFYIRLKLPPPKKSFIIRTQGKARREKSLKVSRFNLLFTAMNLRRLTHTKNPISTGWTRQQEESTRNLLLEQICIYTRREYKVIQK